MVHNFRKGLKIESINNMSEEESKIGEQQEKKYKLNTITGRGWEEYEYLLRIKPEALTNETVLNFGSGFSELYKDLKDKGIDCNMVDFELRYRPWEPKDRAFVQGTGVKLGFKDNQFDHVLALWSTYQIPPEDRKAVFKELMRVGKIIHMGPIFGNEYKMLNALVEEQDYEIVACKSLRNKSSFMFSSKEDYINYMKKRSLDRIVALERDEPLIKTTKLGMKYISYEGAKTIILKRKQI